MLFEGGLGVLAPPTAADQQMLYSCYYPGGWFTTKSPTCEGENSTMLGEIGPLHGTPPAGRPSKPIYRCVVPTTGDHYNTTVRGCENGEHRDEGLLGYTLAYRQLIRYTSEVPGVGHLTTSSLAETEPNYRVEGPQGMLGLTAEAGTRGLYSCTDGTDDFSATDPKCEDKTVRRWEGAIWDQPPAFAAASAALYSCRRDDSSAERFTSFDEFCEGHTRVSRLGYVITRLY